MKMKNLKTLKNKKLFELYAKLHGDFELENQEVARKTYNAIFDRDDANFKPLHMYETLKEIETEILERAKARIVEPKEDVEEIQEIARDCSSCIHKEKLMASEVCTECSLNYARWERAKKEAN